MHAIDNALPLSFRPFHPSLTHRSLTPPTSHLVDLQDSGLHWSGILQLFRLQLATYQRNTFSVPLDGSTLYTFSRRDVMKALGLRVRAPETRMG